MLLGKIRGGKKGKKWQICKSYNMFEGDNEKENRLQAADGQYFCSTLFKDNDFAVYGQSFRLNTFTRSMNRKV